MLINDWTDLESNAGFIKDYHAGSPSPANTILVNGLGRFHEIVGENGTRRYTPTTVFNVKKVNCVRISDRLVVFELTYWDVGFRI